MFLFLDRERLIHLLALRPYKKPELYDRINRGEEEISSSRVSFGTAVRSSRLICGSFTEGIKERERSIMTTILKQVAFMRDNTYHLHRYVWNDVQEDWPYYTEQEKAMLKRRKPQNLTPPGSSDGSSGKLHIYELTLASNLSCLTFNENSAHPLKLRCLGVQVYPRSFHPRSMHATCTLTCCR